MAEQEGDVRLFQTEDDGNITVEGGIVTMNGGLETAVYLSLFGGNEDDDGRAENQTNWWANIDEVDQAKKYRSETQNLLHRIPATSGNLLRIEGAANRDLSWFIQGKLASSVNVVASIPGINRIKLTINIEVQGEKSTFDFMANWQVGA